jgi:hypothetical protein
MVMLVQHTEITARHKDKAILYWFGPPESKTLRPVLDCITSIVAGLHSRGVDGLLYPSGRPCPPYIGGRTRSMDRSPGRLQQRNLSLVNYNMEYLSEPP